MGVFKVEKCIFTNLPIIDYPSGGDFIEYWLDIHPYKHFIRLQSDAIKWEENDKFFREYKYIARSLILNNHWFNDGDTITLESFKDLVSKIDFPKTAEQKAQKLFWYLFNLQSEDGEIFNSETLFWQNNAWQLLYFKSSKECCFYFNHLNNIGLIKIGNYMANETSKVKASTFYMHQ